MRNAGCEMSFPGSEDYDAGCSPVRDLTLLEQIDYWRQRAQLAEECAHQNHAKLLAVCEAQLAERDSKDEEGEWWKTDLATD